MKNDYIFLKKEILTLDMSIKTLKIYTPNYLLTYYLQKISKITPVATLASSRFSKQYFFSSCDKRTRVVIMSDYKTM